MKRWQVLASGTAIVLAIGAGVVVVGSWLSRKTQAVAEIGGPFALTNGAGKPVTDGDFRGRYMLVYFGYTHCPDACPTTLNDIATAFDKLPPSDRARLVPIFITVDPERDTPAVMGDYVRAFGPEFVGLTGKPQAIAQAEQEYRVYAQKTPLRGGDFAMDHSSILYLMGPDGHFVAVLPEAASPADMAKTLRDFGV